MQRYAHAFAGAAAVAFVVQHHGTVLVVELDCLVGARVVAESAADQLVRQAPVGVDDGFADDDVLLRGACRQLQRARGAGRDAQRRAAVLLGAPVAVAVAEVERRRAHVQDAVFDVRRTDDVAWADLVAFLAADACADQAVLILSSRRADDGLRVRQLQPSQAQHHRGAADAQAQRAARHAAGFRLPLCRGMRPCRARRFPRLLRAVFGQVRAVVRVVHLSFFRSRPMQSPLADALYAGKPGRAKPPARRLRSALAGAARYSSSVRTSSKNALSVFRKPSVR